MNVKAVYASTNPSCDSLMLYDGHEPVARIHDQAFLELLKPGQLLKWYAGHATFNLPVGTLRDACDKWLRRF